MQRFVARQNIEHYRLLLKHETDPAKRDVLSKLLAEEEAKFGDPELSLAKAKKDTSPDSL